MAEQEIRRFEVPIVWSGDARGAGEARVEGGSIPIPLAGAVSLGGSGGKANPEDLLLAALGACFVNTWAIFLAKLGLSYGKPSLRASAELEADPAGGFRFLKATIRARVPAVLLAADREKIEKTVRLAEKYCIVSKVVRSAMPLEVTIEEA
jgi:osmotically inducible protein OsmC